MKLITVYAKKTTQHPTYGKLIMGKEVVIDERHFFDGLYSKTPLNIVLKKEKRGGKK